MLEYNVIMLVGPPGSGKTSACRNLPPEQVLKVEGEAEKLPMSFRYQEKEKDVKVKFSTLYTPLTATSGNVIRVLSPYKGDSKKIFFFEGILELCKKRGFRYIVLEDMLGLLTKAVAEFKLGVKDDRQAYQKLITFHASLMAMVALAKSYDVIVIINHQKAPNADEVVVPGSYFREVMVPPSMVNICFEAIKKSSKEFVLRANELGLGRAPDGLMEAIEGFKAVDGTIPNDLLPVCEEMRNW